MSLRHCRTIVDRSLGTISAVGTLATWGVLAATSLPSTTWAQQPPTLQTLAEQGQYWGDKGDAIRAKEAWSKLLAAQPLNAQALNGLARVELLAKRPEDAALYLGQLQKAHPQSPLIAPLAQDIRVARNPQALEQARQLARSGKTTQAVKNYQTILGDMKPDGDFGLEYYQTLAATEGGWLEAEAGLRRIAEAQPSNSKATAALAKQLTYRENTRREGIRMLAKLAAKDTALVADWRQALEWLNATKADIPLYQTYLSQYSADDAVAQRLAELRSPSGNNTSTGAGSATPSRIDNRFSPQPGFKAIEKGEWSQAQAHFERLLAHNPRDRDALGGMGVLRMRQQRWDAAVAFFDQAIDFGARQWKDERATAAYQAALAAARTALQQGNTTQALAQVQAAEQVSNQLPDAPNLRAAILSQTGQHAQAQTLYRQVLAQYPKNIEAHTGMVTSLEQSQGIEAAWAWVEQRPAIDWPIGLWKQLQAQRALAKADTLLRKTPIDTSAVRAAVADALTRDGDNPWTRLTAARHLLVLGDTTQASTTAAPLLQITSSNTQTDNATINRLYAGALWQFELGDWAATLATLNRISPASMPVAATALAERARAHQVLDGIAQQLQGGQITAAKQSLDRLGSLPQDPLLTSRLARYFAQAGDLPRGLTILKAALSQGAHATHAIQKHTDTGLQLEYAGLLLQAQQDDTAQRVLRSLEERQLTLAQRNSFASLQLSLATREADRLRTAEQLNDARNLLVPLLAQHPKNATVQGAWARLLAAEGQNQEAWSTYQNLLQQEPDNLDVLLPAAQLASVQRRHDEAQAITDKALRIAPQDAQALAVAGQVAHQRGANIKAMEYYTAALAAQPQQAHTQQTAQQGLDDIRMRRAPVLIVGLLARSRNGDSGLSQLRAVEAPIQLQWGAGDGLLSLRITPTRLDAGNAAAGSNAASRFGSGPLATGAPGQQDNTGTGVSLAYASRQWQADIGTRPSGAVGSTVLGGIRYSTDITADTRLSLALSRRMLSDSLLSMTGAQDARTGERWGGVTATGVRIGASHATDSRNGIYGYGALYRITGTQVASNNRAEAGAGWYRHLRYSRNERLTVGLFANIMTHSDNLRFFTIGHGGYFSPQQYASLSVPIEWAERSGPWSYRLRASVGVQHFREDAAPYTPLSPTSSPLLYAGQSETGLTYSLGAAMEYKLAPQWVVGSKVGLESARGFREWGGGIYMRYGWLPGPAQPAFPLETLESTYTPEP